MFPSKAFVFVLLLLLPANNIFESNKDIGSVRKSGTVEYNPAVHTYQVMGGGTDISGKEDSFHFVYKRFSGNFTITADVAFIDKGAEPNPKLALMIRQNLAPDSPYADVALQGNGATTLQYRPSAGVDASNFPVAMRSPTHLSISRHGHEFSITAGYSGTQPASAGPIIVTMQDPVYIGLAVCSRNADQLATAKFANVAVK